MNLYCDFGDPEHAGDLLVQSTFDDEREHTVVLKRLRALLGVGHG